jgi:hypothetical protein
MFEYQVVTHRVAYEKGGIKRDYEAVIHERAQQGWRLVQIFIPQPAAVVTEYVLIFERPVAAPSD